MKLPNGEHAEDPVKRIPELSYVALLEDLPEHGLVRGNTGTIVEELTADVCLVEFSDTDGQTVAMPVVPYRSLLWLHHPQPSA